MLRFLSFVKNQGKMFILHRFVCSKSVFINLLYRSEVLHVVIDFCIEDIFKCSFLYGNMCILILKSSQKIMATFIWVNMGSGNGLVPDLSLKVFCGIHLRTSSREVLINYSVTCVRGLHFEKIIPHLPGTNELTDYWDEKEIMSQELWRRCLFHCILVWFEAVQF